MKYYKILDDFIYATDDLTKEDLARAKDGSYDVIINRIEETYYDKHKNDWVKIDGT